MSKIANANGFRNEWDYERAVTFFRRKFQFVISFESHFNFLTYISLVNVYIIARFVKSLVMNSILYQLEPIC